MLRFYRTTEGIVIALSLYVAVCVGASVAWPIVSAWSLFVSVPFALLMLVVGGVGLYLYADAVQRVFEALIARFGDFINEVMSV